MDVLESNVSLLFRGVNVIVLSNNLLLTIENKCLFITVIWVTKKCINTKVTIFSENDCESNEKCQIGVGSTTWYCVSRVI